MKGVSTICVVLLILLGPLVVAIDGVDLLVQNPGRPSQDNPVHAEEPITTSSLGEGGSVGPSFTENRDQFGQWPAMYYAMGRPFSVAFGEGWIAYDLQGEDVVGSRSGTVIRVSFEGAADVSPEGRGTLGHVNNYLRGREPSGWITDVPTYERIVYPDLWEGIDMAFHFADGELKYEFTVAPGADPSSIVMVYEGMDTMEVHEVTGDLLVRGGGLVMRDRAPVSLQQVGEDRVEVATEFELLGGGRVGFDVDRYDPEIALTIDPVMMFCTFLGESGDDEGLDVAVDQDGHAYVAGLTTSAKFPLTAGAYDTVISSSDAFISKFSPNGSTLEYSTFIGGDQYDKAAGIAVDLMGNVYLVGTTNSTDFPVTGGAFCTTRPGLNDTFALKLNVTGSSLEYSTYIGGSGHEMTKAVDIDATGSIYITGWTQSTNFPTVDGSFRRSGDGTDIYLVKLGVDGSDLDYSVLIGGKYDEGPNDIAIDETGCAYITGETYSEDYPIVPGAFDPYFGGESSNYSDVFVTKLNATGESLEYSTYIGHMNDDVGIGIDVDAEGSAYVVGATKSGYFPVKPRFGMPPPRFSWDSFILKLAASGQYLNYSKVLNPYYRDEARAVSVDEWGRAYVTGIIIDTGIPTTPDAFQPLNLGDGDAYVLKMDAGGDSVLYASYLGGNGEDYGNAIALDGNETVFITGKTYSTQGFPTTPGVYDNTSDATTSGSPQGDAFLCRLDISRPYLVNDNGHFNATTGETYTFNLTIADNVGIVGHGLQYWFEGGNETNITLELVEGDHSNGNWTATIDIPNDSIAPLYYRVWANDAAGFNVTIRDHSIPVVDNDLPFLENLTPVTGGTGNEFNLSVRVVDNVGISRIRAICTLAELPSIPPDAGMTPVDITDTGNGIYNLTIVLPRYSGIPIQYWFWTNDTSGNRNWTATYLIDIVDDDDSLFSITPLPREVTTGQVLEPLLFVRDQDIGIASVIFTWWFDVGGDPEPTIQTMVPRSVDPWGNGHYTITFQVPFDVPYPYAPPISVTFSVTDLSGNNVTTEVFVLILRDDDPPWLGIIDPEVPTTGDPFNLTVRVWDNIALSGVWVDYRFDKDLVGSVSLSQEDETTWTATVTIPTSATFISYIFTAMDTTGNMNGSARVNLLVLDNDPPIVVTDNSDSEFKTSGNITFEIIVVDNLVVDLVTVLYWSGEGEPLVDELVGEDLDRRKNGTYRLTVDTPPGINSSLTYVIEVRDGSGNTATTEERSVRILDDNPPIFMNDLSDVQAWRGEIFNFSAEVWDNVGVDDLSCEWWFGEDGHDDGPVQLNSSLVISIPLDPVGPLRYFFTVLDAAGNSFSTDVFHREVLNVPPTLEGIDVWSVMEEKHEELDLRQFIVDRDDSAWDLILESPDPRVTLNGYLLRVHHDIAMTNYSISISVTDGKDTTWHDVTVHVVSVNDPPEIYEMRFNGLLVDDIDLNFTFREGEEDVLTVHARDEEWDPLVYTWWRNDRQIASGQILKHGNLPTGEFDLTLRVDDGSNITSLNFHFKVTVREPIYPSWQWAVVVLLVLAVIAVYIFKNPKEHDD